MSPYTQQEWNLLIRQDDPEGWHALGGDLASWQPKVESVCARHGLAIDGEITMGDFTNTLFFTRNLAGGCCRSPSPLYMSTPRGRRERSAKSPRSLPSRREHDPF